MNLKKKLTAALAMLLVATTLMTTTSYAWFILSTAPEVTGIETQVGANGSLEIALLNTDTRADMSTIRSGIGDSLAANNLAANNAWGNLVDLGFIDYGLGSLLLMPARLNAIVSGEGYSVDPGMLAVPTYGYDGRIVELTDNTISAIYQNNAFAYNSGVQDYGVRAIGTSDALSVQGSSLATAKGNITAYTKSARTNAAAVLSSSGDTLFGIVLTHSSSSTATYGDAERDALKSMLVDLEKSLTDIDASLRQGLVAYAASEIDSEETFNLVKDRIMDSSVELKTILTDLSEVGTVPAEFATWVNELDDMQNDLNAAKNACDALTSGIYTWQEIRGILDYVMNVEYLYIEGTLFSNVDPATLMGLVGKEMTMTLAPGSGIYADIAKFVDNYSTVMTVYGTDIEITTASAVKPSYLQALATEVSTLEAAGGGEEAAALPLTATYGYALDLAFRCNAAEPDLVLQTTPEQRVYEESESGSTQGGGSYMEFTSKDELLTLEQKLKLMDAIRVGFLDDQGAILGIAKLNVSNRTVEDGLVQAPLYLYDYTFEEDETGLFLTMGERKLTDNLITTLVQNVAKAVTVVVWLDGDLVDNTMVSATEAASLNGVLNLQFATSAELIPATDGALLDYSVDKSGLEALIQEHAQTAEAGQGTYTNVSWNAFITAYNRAVSLNDSDNPGEVQIRNAMLNLVKAAAALEVVSQDPVNEKIALLRGQMGTVEDETARLVIDNGEEGYTAVGNEEHTQEEHDSWDIVGEINRVDYNMNLNDEGNGIYTPIYSDESWAALAAALYEAEAVVQNENATDDQLNAALSAMETAEKALARQVFFKPYEYKGAIYYEAICDSENADTYGKWYDSSFKRIVSDLTILNLDAYAQPAEITQIGQDVYVSSDTAYINPDISFLEAIYPELRGEEIQGVKWNDLDSDLFVEVMNAQHLATLNNLISIVDSESLTVDTADAQKLVDNYASTDTNVETPTAEAAEAAIQTLNDAVVAALEDKAQAESGEGTNMTANQRILLTSAVNSAKAVEGYGTDAELANLKTATEAAEKLLADEAVATKEQATTALSDLNAALKAAGANEVTEYNTLTHKLPEGFGASDIVYDVEYPGITVKLTGKSGTSTIGAQILTKNGVVVTVTKDITVYDCADGVVLRQAGNEITALDLAVDGTTELTAALLYEEGGVNTGDKALSELLCENIKSYTWASSNTQVVTVTDKAAGTCTISGVSAGAAMISVSLETYEGNFYAYEIPVTITE